MSINNYDPVSGEMINPFKEEMEKDMSKTFCNKHNFYNTPCTNCVVEIKDKKISELKDLLREVEWVRHSSAQFSCQICGRWRDQGHEANCRLAKAVGK